MDFSNTLITRHKKLDKTNSQLGFTLIELMVTITIAAIIISISIPSFASLLARNKVTVQTNALFESLYLARNYAITEQKKVHVCHRDNSNSTECDPQRNYNSAWHNGWLVFVDKNDNNDYDQNDKLIRVFEPTTQTNIVFNQQGRLRFFPNGSARSAGFYVCDQQQKTYRHVYLLHSGRVRSNSSMTVQQKATCDAA